MTFLTDDHPSLPRRFRSRVAWTTSLAVLFAFGLLLTLVGGADAAPTAVPLGAAQSFAVLAGSGITNTGPTTINGDLGTYPTTTFTTTGSLTINGTNHGGDGVTQSAQTDLVTAYNAIRDEVPTAPVAGLGGGQTLLPGVYNSGSTIGVTGALTLDGGGDPNAVFVFQAGSALTTASSSQINLIGGAQACNVFWQIATDATLGTDSTFVGNLVALNSITVTTGVTVDGRVLARNGAVTLGADTISASACSAPPSTGTTPGVTTTTQPVATTTVSVPTTTASGPTTAEPVPTTTESVTSTSASVATAPTQPVSTTRSTTTDAGATTVTQPSSSVPTTSVGLVNAAPARGDRSVASTQVAKTAARKAAVSRARVATATSAHKLVVAKKSTTARKSTATSTRKARNTVTVARRRAAVSRGAASSGHHAIARRPVVHVGLTG